MIDAIGQALRAGAHDATGAHDGIVPGASAFTVQKPARPEVGRRIGGDAVHAGRASVEYALPAGIVTKRWASFERMIF